MTIEKVEKTTKHFTIHYTNEVDNAKESVTHSSEIAPMQSFMDKFLSLNKYVVKICGLPDDSKDDYVMINYSVKQQNKNKVGLTLSAKKPVTYSNSPFNCNTPRVVLDFNSSQEDILDELKQIIKELNQMAEDYVNGAVSQERMFDESTIEVKKKRGRKPANPAQGTDSF